MLRERLTDQNNGVFLANEIGFKNARNDSVSRILIPSEFSHHKSIPKFVPNALNETALEQEIKRIVSLQSATLDNAKERRQITVADYQDMKMRLSPRHARLSNHLGHEQLRDAVNS